LAAPTEAVQFSFLDPAYTQDIYAGPNVGLPGAWTSTGELLARKSNVNEILEYSSTQNAVHQGTNVASVTTHTVPNLANGSNLTRGLNGFLYLPTTVGLQRVNPNNYAQPAVTVTPFGTQGYSVNTLPNGNIVYAAGANNNEIHIYNPTTNTDSGVVYTASNLIDDIETSVTGIISLAGVVNNEIILLNSTGGHIQTIPHNDFPDGLAFHTAGSPPKLYSNDNHGTITRFEFGAGYNSPPTNTTVIASGGSYGDIACTGACNFYVTQFFNSGIRGSALFGTNWDNGVTNNEPSIIEIGAKDGCLFDPPVGFGVPEPGSAVLMLMALVAFACTRSR
jgi:hypothetical protein